MGDADDPAVCSHEVGQCEYVMADTTSDVEQYLARARGEGFDAKPLDGYQAALSDY